jgi:hypothetical protein
MSAAKIIIVIILILYTSYYYKRFERQKQVSTNYIRTFDFDVAVVQTSVEVKHAPCRLQFLNYRCWQVFEELV